MVRQLNNEIWFVEAPNRLATDNFERLMRDIDLMQIIKREGKVVLNAQVGVNGFGEMLAIQKPKKKVCKTESEAIEYAEKIILLGEL